MNEPLIKKKVSHKRVRNFLAKKLREEPKFKPKRIENKKRKNVDPEDDYSYVDGWINPS